MKRIAINGFGRIGSSLFHLIEQKNASDIEIVAINDLMNIDAAVHSIKYDTVRGRFNGTVAAKNGNLVVNNKTIEWVSEKDPSKLPWKEKKIDLVIEATGIFASYEKSRLHLDAGAKKVIITAPVKDTPPGDIKGGTILVGVNDVELNNMDITSNASCTTNSVGIPMKVLDDELGIEKAMLTTVHAYTASQSLVDSPPKKEGSRSNRAGATNIIPSTTGAAIATTKVLTGLKGAFDGVALRVPVISGSIADITFVSKKDTTIEKVNAILEEASKKPEYSKLFATTKEPIVSSDIIGTPYAALVDLQLTRVVGGNLVKIFSWYDNEMGYTSALYEHILKS